MLENEIKWENGLSNKEKEVLKRIRKKLKIKIAPQNGIQIFGPEEDESRTSTRSNSSFFQDYEIPSALSGEKDTNVTELNTNEMTIMLDSFQFDGIEGFPSIDEQIEKTKPISEFLISRSKPMLISLNFRHGFDAFMFSQSKDPFHSPTKDKATLSPLSSTTNSPLSTYRSPRKESVSESLGETIEYFTCPSHKNEKCNHYCCQCRKLVCSFDLIDSEYNSHSASCANHLKNVISLGQYQNEIEKQLNNDVSLLVNYNTLLSRENDDLREVSKKIKQRSKFNRELIQEIESNSIRIRETLQSKLKTSQNPNENNGKFQIMKEIMELNSRNTELISKIEKQLEQPFEFDSENIISSRRNSEFSFGFEEDIDQNEIFTIKSQNEKNHIEISKRKLDLERYKQEIEDNQRFIANIEENFKTNQKRIEEIEKKVKYSPRKPNFDTKSPQKSPELSPRSPEDNSPSSPLSQSPKNVALQTQLFQNPQILSNLSVSSIKQKNNNNKIIVSLVAADTNPAFLTNVKMFLTKESEFLSPRTPKPGNFEISVSHIKNILAPDFKDVISVRKFSDTDVFLVYSWSGLIPELFGDFLFQKLQNGKGVVLMFGCTSQNPFNDPASFGMQQSEKFETLLPFTRGPTISNDGPKKIVKLLEKDEILKGSFLFFQKEIYSFHLFFEFKRCSNIQWWKVLLSFTNQSFVSRYPKQE